VRMDGEKVLMDVFVPIFSFKDSKNREKITASRDNPVNGYGVTGVLVMTLSVKDALQDLIAANVQLLKGQKIYVFQGISGGVQMVRLGHEHEGIFSQDKDMMTHENLKKVWDIYYLNEGKHDLSKMPHFGASSQTMPRPGEILMRKQKIERLPLTMMVYLNLHTAYQDLLLQRRQLHLIGQLIALLLFVFILAFWWKMQDKRHSLLAKQYLEFSKKINAQRHLLISINSAVNEHITLKYFDGKYVYVNKAFAKFLGLQVEDILHKSDYALFSGKIAEELRDMDKRLLRNKKTVFQENDFKVRGHRYYLAISKTPFLDGNRKFVGIITVVKDLTEVASERQLREKAINNSMQSMMRIMQRHDDHLVKHIEYLKSLTLNLADRLNLSTEDKTTLEVASNLSQLGKIYVSKDILNASGELNDRDLAIYRKHIEDTAFILDTVDWGLPVVDTVYTMHEKLDGTGYPNNLRAPDISKLSRILAICDCFCKLVIPRRGHKVFTPEEAIKWMVNQKGKYDLSIIQSFAEMITEDESIALVG
jgi:PAS domain S-box-containing protein